MPNSYENYSILKVQGDSRSLVSWVTMLSYSVVLRPSLELPLTDWLTDWLTEWLTDWLTCTWRLSQEQWRGQQRRHRLGDCGGKRWRRGGRAPGWGWWWRLLSSVTTCCCSSQLPSVCLISPPAGWRRQSMYFCMLCILTVSDSGSSTSHLPLTSYIYFSIKMIFSIQIFYVNISLFIFIVTS